jgi:small subunit ribosomal protein S1
MSEDHFPKVEGGDKEKILENLEQLIEQDIEVKIINFNSTQGKIIVSEKKIEEDKMNDIINKYKVGDIVEGTFNKSINGGAIISLKDHPLIKAFLPIEEISWTPIENLEDIIKPDQIYKFKLISINKNRELILSLRELQEDPVIEKLRQYKPGQTIKGKVYKFIPVGALIQIEDNVFGFVHSSEFGGIEEMQSKITLNQELEFIVSEVNPNEKRINLSLKK